MPSCYRFILLTALAKEQEEQRDFEHSITVLRRQLSLLRERCAALDVEIEQHRVAALNLQHG